MSDTFVSSDVLQQDLFDRLSSMFGREVPLYAKSLAVNHACNKVVVNLLTQKFHGFNRNEEQLLRTGRERHGAIRIGREDEFRWITRYFACFGMEPHDFYDMTMLGEKSQPVIATAFRSRNHPENRIFASLLRPEYFGPKVSNRIHSALKDRQVISTNAQSIIEKCERDGGLQVEDGRSLVAEGSERIFRWTGNATCRSLYQDLCDMGYKIAADICCFPSHHLNHLTPNSLSIDLFSSAMKWRMGEMSEDSFAQQAFELLERLHARVDSDWLMLHFSDLSHAQMDSYEDMVVKRDSLLNHASALVESLRQKEFDFTSYSHNGYKDRTEGPDEDSQVLLRQDSYRALTESIAFVDEVPPYQSCHTARFGEIEQRFYATTSLGRDLYDECLALSHKANCEGESNSNPFGSIPKKLNELIAEGLVFAEFEPNTDAVPSDEGLTGLSVQDLIERGLLLYRGQRYEDFLPFSAAGIFASNLDHYGTESSVEHRSPYRKDFFERIAGREFVSSAELYSSIHQNSLQSSLEYLGVAFGD